MLIFVLFFKDEWGPIFYWLLLEPVFFINVLLKMMVKEGGGIPVITTSLICLLETEIYKHNDLLY